LTALITVENESNRPVEVRPTLHFRTTSGSNYYTLPSISLPKNGSGVVNLKNIVSSGVPDASGATIPAGTTFGTMTLSIVGGRISDRIAGGSISADPTQGAYGGLMMPMCNDPGPWNGLAVFYLNGIELPPCWSFKPAVDVCALFGDCGGGGGGDPEPPAEQVLTLSTFDSSCTASSTTVTLGCAWKNSSCGFRDNFPLANPVPARSTCSGTTKALIFTSAHAGIAVSCAPTVTADNRCFGVTTPLDERITSAPFQEAVAPPSDPPPDPPSPPIPDLSNM
jgi:hypothetical protein